MSAGAFLDLPRQKAGAGEVKNDFVVRLPFVFRGDFYQAVLQTCGGKNRHRSGRNRKRAGQQGQTDKKLEAGRYTHCDISCTTARPGVKVNAPHHWDFLKSVA